MGNKLNWEKAHKQDLLRRAGPKSRGVSAIIKARFDGYCRECDRPWKKNTKIIKGLTGWQHYRCPDREQPEVVAAIEAAFRDKP